MHYLDNKQVGELGRILAPKPTIKLMDVGTQNLSVDRSDNKSKWAILIIGADNGLAPIKNDCKFNLWLVRSSRHGDI